MTSGSYRGRARAGLFAALLASLGAVCCGAAADSSHYHLLRSVTLGGSDGWDYITADPETDRLFITRGTHMMVVAAASGALVGDVRGLKRAHGVALAGGRAHISDGGANSVVVGPATHRVYLVGAELKPAAATPGDPHPARPSYPAPSGC